MERNVTFCVSCGGAAEASDKFCHSCGRPLRKTDSGAPDAAGQSVQTDALPPPVSVPDETAAARLHAGGAVAPRAWWQSEGAVAWAMILFLPLGLLLMWLYAPWSPRTKWIWSVVGSIVAVFAIAVVAGTESDPTGDSLRNGAVLRTPQPASADRGDDAAVSAYADAFAPIGIDWFAAMSDLSSHFNGAASDPALVLSTRWQSDVRRTLDELRDIDSRINAVPVPPELAHVDVEIQAALSAQRSADREIRAALAEFDAGDIDGALRHAEAGAAQISVFGEHLGRASQLVEDYVLSTE